MKYPAIPSQQHSPDEPFTNGSAGSTISTLQSFWQWAYSDLIGNTVRGDIAEYLVVSALGITHIPRSSWSRYDLLSPEGISVEVKASGYIQAWGQEKLSKISFQIPKTRGWDQEQGVYEEEVKRQADVYVFCVHNCMEQEKINPLDVSQWDFYVVPTSVLNESCGNQQSIALSRLKRIGTVKCGYEELHERIVGVAHPVKTVRYLGESDPLSLLHGKLYKVISVEMGMYRIIDETGEDYLYDPEGFEDVDN